MLLGCIWFIYASAESVCSASGSTGDKLVLGGGVEKNLKLKENRGKVSCNPKYFREK